MSEFNDFTAAALSEAFTVIGTTSVTINAISYNAIFDEFTAERELEIGGYVGTYAATALLKAADLSALTAPIERTLEGKTLTMSGRTFRIDRAAIDEAGVTLGLNNPDKRKK